MRGIEGGPFHNPFPFNSGYDGEKIEPVEKVQKEMQRNPEQMPQEPEDTPEEIAARARGPWDGLENGDVIRGKKEGDDFSEPLAWASGDK